MLDHGTGIVIGETAAVGDNCSILQGVTLGGTGKETGDRHPKIGDNVLISVGAKVLGNIKVGDCSRVGAGSVVLEGGAAATRRLPACRPRWSAPPAARSLPAPWISASHPTIAAAARERVRKGAVCEPAGDGASADLPAQGVRRQDPVRARAPQDQGLGRGLRRRRVRRHPDRARTRTASCATSSRWPFSRWISRTRDLPETSRSWRFTSSTATALRCRPTAASGWPTTPSLVGKVVIEEDASVWFNTVARGDNEPIVIGARSQRAGRLRAAHRSGLSADDRAEATIGHMVMLHGCTHRPRRADRHRRHRAERRQDRRGVPDRRRRADPGRQGDPGALGRDRLARQDHAPGDGSGAASACAAGVQLYVNAVAGLRARRCKPQTG